MRRRDVLVGGSAALAAAAFPKIALSQIQEDAAQKIGRFIDVHCHLVNASDLPIEDFLEKVVLAERLRKSQRNSAVAGILTRHPKAAQALIFAVASVVRKAAPTPGDEIGQLIAQDSVLTQKDIVLLERVLNILWRFKLVKEEDFGIFDREILMVGTSQVRYLLRREIYSNLSSLPEDENRNDPETDQEIDEEISRIARKISVSDGPLGHIIRWGINFSRSRSDLAKALFEEHSRAGKVVLMTPALLDFEKWIYDVPALPPKRKVPPPAPIEKQVEALKLLSLRKVGPRMHAFVGYDPLRQILYDRLPSAEKGTQKSPLRVVQNAIENDGCIGVKLYPAMGFMPYGNVRLQTDVAQNYNLKPSEAAKAMDQALWDLFVWCKDNRVPVMAHANESNSPFEEGNGNGSPKKWGVLLQKLKSEPSFAQFRLNLAHFGGFEQNQPPDEDENKADTWEWQFGELKKAYPQPYLFADLAYLEEVLPIPKQIVFPLSIQDRRTEAVAIAERAKLRGFVKTIFKTYKDNFANAADYLMFGSDWNMIGQDRAYADGVIGQRKPYAQLVFEFLSELEYSPADLDKIMFKNAVTFLGLGPDQRDGGTRGRLESFYKRNNADPAWLTVFDS